MKDTNLRCYHAVKIRNVLPVFIIQHLAESKKRTESKYALKKRNTISKGRALVRILS